MHEVSILTIQGELNQPSEVFIQFALGSTPEVLSLHNRQTIAVDIARYAMRGPISLQYCKTAPTSEERRIARANVSLQAEMQRLVLGQSLAGCAIQRFHAEEQPLSGLEAGIRIYGSPNRRLVQVQQAVFDVQASLLQGAQRSFEPQDGHILIRLGIHHNERRALQALKTTNQAAYDTRIAELKALIDATSDTCTRRVEAQLGRISALHFKPAHPKLVRKLYQQK
ncbi:hypothetical protein CYG49_00885 [Candidatus Saccharibacteria bacterium]|nr:MAG: hypothetical protein CYG49_00885 [Candidatus Saccharibacteria bacterium]